MEIIDYKAQYERLNREVKSLKAEKSGLVGKIENLRETNRILLKNSEMKAGRKKTDELKTQNTELKLKYAGLKQKYAEVNTAYNSITGLIKKNYPALVKTVAMAIEFKSRSDMYHDIFNDLTESLQWYISLKIKNEPCTELVEKIRRGITKSIKIRQTAEELIKTPDTEIKQTEPEMNQAELKKLFDDCYFNVTDFEFVINELKRLFIDNDSNPSNEELVASLIKSNIHIKFFDEFERNEPAFSFQMVKDEKKEAVRLPGIFVRENSGEFKLYGNMRGQEPIG